MQPNYSEISAKIIAKAWKDPTFKEKLMKNPHEAFKEFGIHIPKDLHITVLEERPQELHIMIPKAPQNIEALSEKDLEAQGGTWTLAAGFTVGFVTQNFC